MTTEIFIPDETKPTCYTNRSQIPYCMMRTPGSDLDTNYMEDWTPHNVNASFVAGIQWGLIGPFVLDMLGDHHQVNGQIHRFNPEPHPYIPFLYCVGCKVIANYGAPTNTEVTDGNGNAQYPISYEYAAVACTFSAFLYDVLTDEAILDEDGTPNEMLRYVERRGKNIGQSLSTVGQFVYASDGAPIPTPPAIQVPHREMTYTWRYVPGPLDDLIALANATYGCVNEEDFDPYVLGDAYPPNTVMYLGMEEQPILATPGGNTGPNRLYDIVHKFAAFTQGPSGNPGWNSVYRPVPPPGRWDQAQTRATPQTPPYAQAPFADLFTL